MSSSACAGHPGRTEHSVSPVAELQKGLPGGSQPLSQKSGSEVRQVATARRHVSGDGTVYPPLVTRPRSGRPREVGH